MALRLLKVLVRPEAEPQVSALLDDLGGHPRWTLRAEKGWLEVQALIPAEGNEPFMDALETGLREQEGARITLLPVQATIPRIEDGKDESEEDESDETEEAGGGRERSAFRVNREELYTSLSDSVKSGPYYLIMTALSAVVASAGLLMDDTAVIIGAMVIAPLLGPNMALPFAITVGDLQMGRTAFRTAGVGALVAFGVAWVLGWILPVDPTLSELAARTDIRFGHIALALASGAAGVLALTRGVATGLVGVMVAVALLPPLAAAGLLIGDGHWAAGVGALLLVVANLACVNLAGIGTFLAQGVRPLSWWEEGEARRAVVLATSAWALVVLVLLAVVWLGWEG